MGMSLRWAIQRKMQFMMAMRELLMKEIDTTLNSSALFAAINSRDRCTDTHCSLPPIVDIRIVLLSA